MVNRLRSLLSSGHIGHLGHLACLGHIGHLGHLGHLGHHFMKSLGHHSFVFNIATDGRTNGQH